MKSQLDIFSSQARDEDGGGASNTNGFDCVRYGTVEELMRVRYVSLCAVSRSDEIRTFG